MRLSVFLLLQLWGNVEVSLSLIACPTLPDVPHAHVSEETRKAEYQGGHVIHFTCESGFTASAPNITYVCSSEGWLAVQQGVCSNKSPACPTLPDVPHAHVSEETKKAEYQGGHVIHFTCEPGYTTSGPTIKYVCTGSGWLAVGQGMCRSQQCPLIRVDNNVQVIGDPEEATYGSVVRFSCKSRDEILDGSPELYCDEHGEWSSQVPKCKGIVCTVPQIENGLLPGAIREYRENEVLHYECDQGFKRIERPSTCIKQGIRAEWSPTPQCESMKCRLTILPGIDYQPVYKNVFSPGDTLTVTCPRTSWISTRQDRSVVTRCQDNGKWSIEPTCQEVRCSGQKPMHVKWWSVSTWRGPHRLDDTVSYTCESHYERTGGATHATCTRDGWVPNPLCEVIHQALTTETTGLKSEYRQGERVQYSCQALYTMEGGPYKTCNNGEWTGPIKCLKPCTVDKDIMKRHNIGFRYSYEEKLYAPHNELIEFRCTTGRHIRPVEMRQRCLDGVMNLPTCL